MILLTLLACGLVGAPDTEPDPVQKRSGDPVASVAIEAAMREHTARLTPGGDHLMVEVFDSEGASVAPTGEGKMVLTGTGEAPQRLVLTPAESGWKADATLSGAPGYLAVVSVPIGGATQSARFSWGDVPQAGPAPAPHAHGADDHDHDDGDHDHDH